MSILLKNAVLLDANYLNEPLDIFIDGDKIAAVGTALGHADQEFDLTGYTVLPSFIDAHVHVATDDHEFKEDAVRAWAYNGVSTVRELGMLSQLSQTNFVQWIKKNNHQPEHAKVIAVGNYIDVAGGYGAGPNPNHPVGSLITSAEEAADEVTNHYKLGYPGIKIGIHDGRMDTSPHLSAEMAKAICERAKSHGMWVASHIGICKGVQFMLDAGVREMAHIPTDPMSDEMIRFMVENDVVMDTTLGDPEAAMEPMPMPRPLPGEKAPELPPMPMDFDPEKMAAERKERWKGMVSNLGRYYRAGGRIVVGTDLIHAMDFNKSAVIPVPELRALTDVGMSLQEAIQAGTIEAANVVGTGDEEGLIQVGRLANLIAVPGRVDESFVALNRENVKLVLHYGTVIRNEV